jgi:hypothetical protein
LMIPALDNALGRAYYCPHYPRFKERSRDHHTTRQMATGFPRALVAR